MDTVLYLGPENNLTLVKEILEPDFCVEYCRPRPEEFWPRFRECVAFLDASMKMLITEEEIFRAKKIKLIAAATTGSSHIDTSALKKKDILLITLKGEKKLLSTLTPAAELSWLLLMACARHLTSAVDHVKAGLWERTSFPGMMLRKKMIGIIGFGRLGSWMAKYAHAFDMSIQATDPYVTVYPQYVRNVKLEKLLSTSDFITIHVHLSPETRNLLSTDKIELIKKGAVLINTSRAEIVDEKAIVKALKDKRLSAVGVDVLMGEPDITNDYLWQFAQDNKNVIITPHIGGFSPEAVEIVVAHTARRIRDTLREHL